MKSLDHNAIARSIALMGFDLERQMRKKRHEADNYGLAETQQQYQVSVSGVAGAGAFTDFTIKFNEIIYFAPQWRNNKMEDPQMSWGAVLDSGRAFFAVNVKEWLLDDKCNYTGAIISIGAQAGAYGGLGGVDGSPYSGTIHLTFQGLSAPVEDTGLAVGPN